MTLRFVAVPYWEHQYQDMKTNIIIKFSQTLKMLKKHFESLFIFIYDFRQYSRFDIRQDRKLKLSVLTNNICIELDSLKVLFGINF